MVGADNQVVQCTHVGLVEFHVPERGVGEALFGFAQSSQRCHDVADLLDIRFGEVGAIHQFLMRIVGVQIVDASGNRGPGFFRYLFRTGHVWYVTPNFLHGSLSSSLSSNIQVSGRNRVWRKAQHECDRDGGPP